MHADRRAFAPSAWLCAAALGCGDIGDAQVPLPLHRRTREPAAEFELIPSGGVGASSPRAVASVSVGATAGRACPVVFEALLPDTSATETLLTGIGERAVDGEAAQVTCQVMAASGQTGGFDVALSLRHDRLPRLVASGHIESPASASAGSEPSLALQLTTADAFDWRVACRVEIDELLDGAIWFHSIACETLASAPGAETCDVGISALFENCRR